MHGLGFVSGLHVGDSRTLLLRIITAFLTLEPILHGDFPLILRPSTRNADYYYYTCTRIYLCLAREKNVVLGVGWDNLFICHGTGVWTFWFHSWRGQGIVIMRKMRLHQRAMYVILDGLVCYIKVQ